MKEKFSDQPPNEDFEDLPTCDNCGKRTVELTFNGTEWICAECEEDDF